MPKLPEVETIKNGLIDICQNSTITKSEIHNYRLRYLVLPNLNSLLKYQAILKVQRRAKYLIFKLDNSYLLFHLGMSGKIYAIQQTDFSQL